MHKKILTVLFCFIFALSVGGCARAPGQAKVDPYEKFNRPMFAFNMDLDHLFMRPMAQVYNFVTPFWVQHRVTNFFDNIDEITSVPNDVLQGKFLFMMNDIWRVLINTTFGLGGLFDVAKHIGLRPHYETFGLTLAYWENNEVESPYLVLPLLGPNTFRSAFGQLIDFPTTPYAYIPYDYWYYDYPSRLLNAVNFRSSLLPANRLIDTAFDPYIFVRNAFLQKRNKVLAENLVETYRGKVTVSNIKMTAQDFESTAVDGAEQSTGITTDKATSEGYILDDEEPAATTTSAPQAPPKKPAATPAHHP